MCDCYFCVVTFAVQHVDKLIYGVS